MRVAALRDLLAEIDGDVLVTIDGFHVEYLQRQHERMGPRLHTEPVRCDDCGHEHKHWTGEPYVTYPASLNLHTRRHNRNDRSRDEPPTQFYGRWTKAQRAAIDKHSEDPDATEPSGREVQ